MDAMIAFGENQTIDRQIKVSHLDYIEEDEVEVIEGRPMPRPSIQP